MGESNKWKIGESMGENGWKMVGKYGFRHIPTYSDHENWIPTLVLVSKHQELDEVTLHLAWRWAAGCLKFHGVNQPGPLVG